MSFSASLPFSSLPGTVRWILVMMDVLRDWGGLAGLWSVHRAVITPPAKKITPSWPDGLCLAPACGGSAGVHDKGCLPLSSSSCKRPTRNRDTCSQGNLTHTHKGCGRQQQSVYGLPEVGHCVRGKRDLFSLNFQH